MRLTKRMLATLRWVEKGGAIGCPGTSHTIRALETRKLMFTSRGPGRIEFTLTDAGRAAIAASK